MLKVGDKVIVNQEIDFQRSEQLKNPIPKGSIGEVVRDTSYSNGSYISVSFEDFIDGHSCGFTCKQGHGWDFPEKYVSLFDPGFDHEIKSALERVYMLG